MGLKYALLLAAIVDRFNQELYRRIVVRVLTAHGVTVRGLPLWVSPSVYWDRQGGITLGDRCVISGDVRLLTHDFSMDRVAERRFGVSPQELFRSAPIEIGAQAFIGMNSTILPGVAVGPGAIVGAGSVVTRDVPADTVVAGNPAIAVCDTETHWARSHSKFTWVPRRP